MPKTRTEKEALVIDLADRIRRSKSLVFVDFRGLNSKGTTKLRRATRALKIDYLVIKKTLMKRAFEAAGMKIDPSGLEGSIGLVFGYEDEVAPAKLMHNFAKEFEAVKMLAGVLEGRLIDAAEVKALAALPSRLELLAKFVGTIKAPVSGFVSVLAGNMRGLVTVLGAIKEQKA